MLKRKTILSLEQALALPYATQRFAQLGWRVIRLENPPEAGGRGGDPNRYIGVDTGQLGMGSYYLAPNAGKEAITINLKKPEGRALLQQLIRELQVDVFMCNTLPMRYAALGIDFASLSKANERLVWCGISAFGPECPDRAGYDPALQASLGFTWLTGEPKGMPVPCGVPIIDLKAGDEAFAQVLLAMLENAPSGKEIHISMARCAASWLITALPQLNFLDKANDHFMRSGSEHRSFIPSNVYATADGFAYLAIGNDLQWSKLCSIPGFEVLAKPERETNEGRKQQRFDIYSEIGALTQNFATQAFVDRCLQVQLSAAPVHTVDQVAEMEALKPYFMHTTLPDGRSIPLSPTAVDTDFLKERGFCLATPPALGADNQKIFGEAGLGASELTSLLQNGVI
ncbi:MAG: CoA transferase [Saprospiraceae bacterium]|nr:CoA transferase [Saprospiraceae bacterium]